MILLGIYLSFFHHSKDIPMDTNKEQQKEEEDWHDCHPVVAKELPSKPLNLLLPLIFVLGLTLFLTWWDGHEKGADFFQAFIQADVLGAMVVALIITFFMTLIFFMLQKIHLKEIIGQFISGGNELMSVILLLSVVWGLSAVTEELGFSTFITTHTEWIPNYFVLPVLFLFGSLISYFIGSSWGTWGILMPLGISLAQASDTSLPMVIGAVFASGTFGAFASPLSDTTVTISKILDLPLLKYARYKLIPALIAAGIATVLYAAATFV
jgi:tetracycline resistance efflux pump